MFLAHSFRLRDPWQCAATEDGGVRWSRVFHRPTGLESDDDLWLVVAGLPKGAVVRLNGQPLAPPPGARPTQFLVTALVVEANRIEIEEVARGARREARGEDASCELRDANNELRAASSESPGAHLAPGDSPRANFDADSEPPRAFPYDVRLGVVGHS